MKYCSKCGHELHDEAVVCTNCGCAVNNNQFVQNQVKNNAALGESSTLATCAIIFAFLVPIIGLVFGIIGAVKYKYESKLKDRCIGAVCISVIGLAIGLGILMSM